MRAFIVHEFGQPGEVGEKPLPVAHEGELLVRVKAAGVNAMDPIIRGGFAQSYREHRFPVTPGSDYAGTVEAVGPSVTSFKPGDEVFGDEGKGHLGDGTFAELVVVDAANAYLRPEALSAATAAALPRAAGTASVAVAATEAQPGATIAVIGAAGGVGGFATQLAVAAGLRVIAVTSGENAAFVRSLGASDVVDYGAGDVPAQLQALVPAGLDGIVDVSTDAQGLLALVPTLKPGKVIATAAGYGADQLFADQPVRLVMVRADYARLPEIAQMAVDGKLQVPVETVSLEDAGRALDRQASRQVVGKIVVTMDAEAE